MTDSNNIALPIGVSSQAVLQDWRSKRGHRYVSIGIQRMTDGDWFWTKKGFAATPQQARDLAAALVDMAARVDALIAEDE